MDDSCAVCADSLEWVAYGSCGHREVCSTCVVRLRFVLEDRRCCICKTESPTVFVTKALGDYTRMIADFSAFPSGANEGQVGSYWYHEGSQSYFDDVDHYRMIKAMCKLSCSICDKNVEENGVESTKRSSRFRNIEQLKGHLFHQHRMQMCSLCLEGRKVFIREQKLYSRSQLSQHIRTGNSEVDGSESERGGFTGHPTCEFCRNPFYGDNELYMHMSTEHYTCHICQRQHPGQYDYFRNYDDLETHFRQEHFLCEDETCLAKKFVVFHTEAEMKRHNTIEHGGHMSRSKRNAALQIPTSFRYRRSNDQDQRRGRGRGFGFGPDPSDNQLSVAIQASLETAIANGGASESSYSSHPGASRGENSQEPSGSEAPPSSRNAHILEESYFPPLSDRAPPEPSSRYAQAFSQRSPAKLKEEFFPPLPGTKEHSKPKQGAEVVGSGSSSTLASRLNRGKVNVKVVNSARPRSSGMHASFPELRPLQTNQVPNASTSARENGSVNETRMRHSSSAPNLGVETANKSLVERIRIGLGNDDERYSTFKSISAEYRQGQINTWEYISYVEQFGLMHLMLELARLCPDPQKQKELIDAYNANINATGSSKEAKNRKKKGKGKDELADDFLNTVRKLQLNQKHQEEAAAAEVEVLSKDGYRTGKSIPNSTTNSTANQSQNPHSKPPSEGLPVRGVWKKSGGQKLFGK